MTAFNKWNKKEYVVKDTEDNNITLLRVEDRKEFTISRAEFNFSYKIKK